MQIIILCDLNFSIELGDVRSPSQDLKPGLREDGRRITGFLNFVHVRDSKLQKNMKFRKLDVFPVPRRGEGDTYSAGSLR
jgi:hypothetical protein